MSAPGEDWFRRAFARPYLEVYAHRDEAAAEAEAEFVAAALGLQPEARVLDAGCGAGRHARALARRGLRVAGVDLSIDLLARAVRDAGGPRYAAGDLRALPFRPAVFDGAVSLFTSFGYFDEAGDRRHLGELRRALRRGGVLVLDFLNAPRVAAGLVPESRRTVAGTEILERRRIADGRVEKVVRVHAPGRAPETWRESVRLYERDALEGLLRGAGFRVRAAYGDLRGGPWSQAAERLVLQAEAA